MNKQITKIDNFFNSVLASEIQNLCMFKTKLGYELFCKYVVVKKNNLFHVSHKYNFTSKIFSSLINAVSWCIFDHRNKILNANKLENLDKDLNGALFDIDLYNKLLETKNPSIETKSLYLAKLNESMLKKEKLLKDINLYTKEAISWQEKQFYAQKNQKV